MDQREQICTFVDHIFHVDLEHNVVGDRVASSTEVFLNPPNHSEKGRARTLDMMDDGEPFLHGEHWMSLDQFHARVIKHL